MELYSKNLRLLTVACLLVGLVASQKSYGRLTNAKQGNPKVQKIADRVKEAVQASDAAGQLSLYKVVQYRTRTVNTNRPEGGFANGMEYYMKIEASTGKFIQVDIAIIEDIGDDVEEVVSRAIVIAVKSTTKDAVIRTT